VSSTSTRCDGYLISWSEPRDEITGVAGYRVWKWGSPGDSVLAAEVTDTFACIPFESDTTYKYYRFSVHPVDLLGNVRITGNSSAETYCARAPVISCAADPLWENRCITVDWNRPVPGSGTGLTYSVGILSEEGEVDSVIHGVRKTDLRYCAYDSGYYRFTVRETAEYPGISTRWSEPCVIPFKSRPDGVEQLHAQPQPLAPGTDAANGTVDIHWKYNSLPGIVEYFRVTRSGGPGKEKTDVLAYSPPDSFYSMRDDSVAAGYSYIYRVVPVDGSGQGSAPDSCLAVYDPPWMFTPGIAAPENLYFRGGSVELEWGWISENCAGTGNGYGAEYCRVQVSGTPGFEEAAETAWIKADEGKAIVDAAPLLGPSSYRLYCRVRGMDRWGNESPWSDSYGGCFSSQPVMAVQDENPPWPVEEISVYSVLADSSSSPDSVDVCLSWTGTVDVAPGSGLDFYRVYRSKPGEEPVYLLDTPDTFAVDQNVRAAEADPCLFEYTVRPVDRLGNVQTHNNPVVCLEVLPSPDSLRALSSRRISWSYPGTEPVDGFIAECSNYREYLGTGLMRFLEDEAVAVIEDRSARSYIFGTSADFVQSDTIYFHVKAFRGDYQSSWSPVFRYPDGAEEELVEPGRPASPVGCRLYQNHPNPFNPITMITFDIASPGKVTLLIFDVRGRVVRRLVDGHRTAGRYSLPWDGKNEEGGNAVSGMYFYRLTAPGYMETRKMILLR
jgi:hypothetical protein